MLRRIMYATSVRFPAGTGSPVRRSNVCAQYVQPSHSSPWFDQDQLACAVRVQQGKVQDDIGAEAVAEEISGLDLERVHQREEILRHVARRVA